MQTDKISNWAKSLLEKYIMPSDSPKAPEDNEGKSNTSHYIPQDDSIMDDQTKVVPYVSHGSANSIGTMIPVGMAGPVYENLRRIECRYGSIGSFVMRELNLPNLFSLEAILSGEQIDGVAMAISEMKRGRGFILGDMTGVGKGRQLAALVRWSILHGTLPVYITEKSVLFSDVYRDMNDIGQGHYRPFILNSDSEARIRDMNGKLVYDLPSKKDMDYFLLTSTLPAGYDYLLLTYSQLNRKEEINQKAAAVKKAILDSFLILDESHNASGMNSNTCNFFLKAIPMAKGVCYASATYAKYPSSMPIYALKTAIGDADVKSRDLIEIVAHGGPVLQEELAKGLTESGCMTRRENDMSGVVRELRIEQDPQRIRNIRRQYDTIIEIAEDIYDFQQRFIEPYLRGIDVEEQMDKSCNLPGNMSWVDKSLRVEFMSFSGRMAPTVQQLLLSAKADDAVRTTIEALQRGEKPIVQINHTMETHLDKLADIGMGLESLDFSMVMHKCLDALFFYSLVGIAKETGQKKGKGTKYRKSFQITLDALKRLYGSNEVVNAFKAIHHKIDKTVTGLPVSPIDYFIYKVEKAGYSVGELTQRKTCIEYRAIDSCSGNSGMSGQYGKNGDAGSSLEPELEGVHVKRSKPDKKQIAADFNNGKLDVLVGNRVMGTGISLHNSPVFQDVRQRVTITWELQDSADRQTQFDGRADRTGQLSHCHYIVLSSPVPAEQRFLMMNERKQKSLNANVTASQKTEANCTDILNKYGSKVVREYLQDHPEMLELFPDLDDDTREENLDESLVRRFMNALALKTCRDQDQMLSDIIMRYNEYIAYLDDKGENDLVSHVLPLKAKVRRRTVFAKGNPLSSSVFGQEAYLEECEVDVLRKPMKKAEIEEMMKHLMKRGDLTPVLEKTIEQKVKNLQKRYTLLRLEAARKIAEILEAQDRNDSEQTYTPRRLRELQHQANNQEAMNQQIDKVMEAHQSLRSMLNYFRIGQSVGVPLSLFPDGAVDDYRKMDFVSVGIFMGYKLIGDKATRSTIKMVFAVNDGRRKLEIPLTDGAILDTIRKQTNLSVTRSRLERVTLRSWDFYRPTRNRETAYIVTGNILQGIAKAQNYGSTISNIHRRRVAQSQMHGHLITYTDIDGGVHHGYLLPRTFRPDLVRA